MITIHLHGLSIFIGFMIGYMVIAAVWIYDSTKDTGEFDRGWKACDEYHEALNEKKREEQDA